MNKYSNLIILLKEIQRIKNKNIQRVTNNIKYTENIKNKNKKYYNEFYSRKSNKRNF